MKYFLKSTKFHEIIKKENGNNKITILILMKQLSFPFKILILYEFLFK